MKSPDLTSAKTSVRAGNGIGAGLLKRAVLRQLGQCGWLVGGFNVAAYPGHQCGMAIGWL